jgi:hypothetical protein
VQSQPRFQQSSAAALNCLEKEKETGSLSRFKAVFLRGGVHQDKRI